MLRNHDLERFRVLDGEGALSLTTFDVGTEALLTDQRLIVREVVTNEMWALPLIDIERLIVIGQVLDDDWPIKWEIRLWFREPLEDDEERDTWGDLILLPADSTQGFAFGAELAHAIERVRPSSQTSL